MGSLHEQIHVGNGMRHDEKNNHPGDEEREDEPEQDPPGQPVGGFEVGFMGCN